MNANHELERRLVDFYASEAPPRAPGRVLESVLATSEITRQRHAVFRLPWRFPNMNSYAKPAIAAVAVIAIGAVGLAVWRGGPPPGPGVVTPTASPNSGPSASPFSELTESFTSSVHGISVSYPADWSAEPATVPWTIGVPGSAVGARDTIADGAANESFVGLASQPLGGEAGEQWANDLLSDPDGYCQPPTEPITVAGAPGLLAHCSDEDTNGLLALAWTQDRGYWIVLYRIDDRAWFDRLLATVELRPEQAVTASAPPLTSTFTSPRYGLTLSYPDGWVVRRTGTEPWTTAHPRHDGDVGDIIDAGPVVEDSGSDQAFIAVASQPLEGTDGEQWAGELVASDEWDDACNAQPGSTIGGSPGVLATGCGVGRVALAWTADRGYLLYFYGLDDYTWYTDTWLDELLAAVQLQPNDAVAP
jgi:hypothetical protein